MTNNLFYYVFVFGAGILSFLSPCVWTLIPVYIGLLSRSPIYALENQTAKDRIHLVLSAVLFAAGFSIVFAIFSFIFSASFLLLGDFRSVINVISGIIIIIFGSNMLFNFIPFLNYEKRIHSQAPQDLAQVFVFGLAFGAGWLPCISPILTSVLLFAAQQEDSFKAVSYLFAYAMGLGLPFIIVSIFFGLFLKTKTKINKILPYINKASAVLIILLGLAILFGKLSVLNSYFNRALWYFLELF
ncbi:MAG: cytochrome c biogenesis protein CcdA [Elusimicrobiota bacterium]|jgi:cytochrome c-type biogenesis protein|nr:cytochrome c biogenesis protein CcdA [Elusimicrobiota bacterium]